MLTSRQSWRVYGEVYVPAQGLRVVLPRRLNQLWLLKQHPWPAKGDNADGIPEPTGWGSPVSLDYRNAWELIKLQFAMLPVHMKLQHLWMDRGSWAERCRPASGLQLFTCPWAMLHYSQTEKVQEAGEEPKFCYSGICDKCLCF